MYRRQTDSWIKYWDFILVDLILLLASYAMTYKVRFHDFDPHDTGIYRSMALILVLLAVCFIFFHENYSNIFRRGYWQELKEVCTFVIVVTAGIITCLFLLKVSAVYSRMFLLLFPCFATLFLYVGRILMKGWIHNRLKFLWKSRELFLAVTSANFEEVADHFLENKDGEFRINGIGILNREDGPLTEYRGIPVFYGSRHSMEAILKNCTDEILFDVGHSTNLPQEMVEQCEVMGLAVHVRLVNVKDTLQKRIVENIEGYTVVSTSMNITSTQQAFFKRLMDIIGSLIGLLLTGILMVFVGPVIYLRSPGPIFFSQIRIGKNGRKFKLYKFRSMDNGADEHKKELMSQNKMEGLMFKMEDDPRIIRGIGTFIRRTSIDEFPQFWNVLKGEMSLVGTRPPTLDEWEQYEMHHRARLAAKPGITGLWQVSGRNDITDFEKIVQLDTKYISEWSIGLDIKILLQTIVVVLGRVGSV